MATQTKSDGTPTNGLLPLIDSLVAGGRWVGGANGRTSITYAFQSGEIYAGTDQTGADWLAYETKAVRAAFALWESVANVKFTEKSGSANIVLWTMDDASMEGFSGSSGVLGASDAPGFTEGPVFTGFNYDDPSWKAANLVAGGYAFVTVIHEIGHALGLAHPHDGGEDPEATVFPGVTTDSDLGVDNLNQGINTVMSYVDGFNTRFPNFSKDGYGWQATPMALDIAAIQAVYGANMSYHAGADVYLLPGVNAAGAAWRCIWDAGGVDVISGKQARSGCYIDLNAAALTGPLAGGAVSSAKGIKGGFTIAHDVTIENARGGKYADVLVGNTADNRLIGAKGADTLWGGDGNDTLLGGAGKDALIGGAGADTLVGHLGDDIFRYDTTELVADVIADFAPGDKVGFSSVVFGTNTSVAVHADAVAVAAEERFIFNTSDASLWFDADGSGAVEAVKIATFSNQYQLSSSDILLL